MADQHWSDVACLLQFANIADGSTTFEDESFPADTFTAVSTAQISGGRLVLADSNDCILTPHNDAYNLGSGDFTLEVFGCRVDSSALDQYLVTKWDAYSPGSNQRSYILRIFPFEFVHSATGGSTSGVPVTSAWTPTVGQTYNLCVERTGDTFRLYVDGAMVASAVAAISFADELSNFAIGAGNTKAGSYRPSGFVGAIDAVRLTRASRYGSDAGYTVPALPLDNTSGLPTWWRTTQLAVETLDEKQRVRSTQTMVETVRQKRRQQSTQTMVEALVKKARPRVTQVAVETLRSTIPARTGLRRRMAGLELDTFIELLEIDLRGLGSTYNQWDLNLEGQGVPDGFTDSDLGIVRFSPNWSGRDIQTLNDIPIYFRGKPFQPAPIQAQGFSWSLDAQLARPTITVADLAGFLLVESFLLDDLLGARVTYTMTDIAYLDYVPGTTTPADPGNGDCWPQEYFLISKLLVADGFTLQWELVSPLDRPNAMIPGRRMTRRDFPGLGRAHG